MRTTMWKKLTYMKSRTTNTLLEQLHEHIKMFMKDVYTSLTWNEDATSNMLRVDGDINN